MWRMGIPMVRRRSAPSPPGGMLSRAQARVLLLSLRVPSARGIRPHVPARRPAKPLRDRSPSAPAAAAATSSSSSSSSVFHDRTRSPSAGAPSPSRRISAASSRAALSTALAAPFAGALFSWSSA